MKARPHVAVASAFLALALLAGCTPAPAPTPTPTVVATGPTEGPSTPSGSPSMTEDELYAEAERVFRAWVAEDEKITRSGGIVTPRFSELTADPLRALMLEDYAGLRKRGEKMAGGSYRIEFIRPAPGKTRKGSVVALSTCVDSRSAQFSVGGKVEKKGSKILSTSYFQLEGSALLLMFQQGSMGDAVC